MTFRTSHRHLGPHLLVATLALLSSFLFIGECLTRFKEMDPNVWTGRQTAASVCLLLAVAVGAWAFGKRDNYGGRLESPGEGRTGARGLLEAKVFLPCLGFYAASIVVYLAYGENATVRWLWALSVVALLVPLRRGFEARDFWPIPFWEYALIGLVMAVALTLRLVHLTDLPYQVDNDVSIMGLFSRKLVEAGSWRMVGMARTEHHYSEHQYIALSMRLFGTNHYGLSMLSVIAGTATCGLVHLLGRMLFNRWVGLIAAALLASNYVHLHFSRILFGPLSTFFVVLSGLALLHGMRRGSRFSFAVGGVSLGLGLMDYYSARIGPVLVLGLFGLWWWQRKRYPAVPLACWLVALVGLVCAFGPNLPYAMEEFSKFSGRGNKVILWTDTAWSHLSEKYQSHGSAYVVIKEQVVRTFLAPFYFPDESTICYLRKPMLGGLAAFGFILGLGFCLRRWREMACVYLLASFVLVFIFGGVLTIDPPFWPHLNIALPAMALIAAIGLERFGRRLILAAPKAAGTIVPTALAGGILFAGVHEWELYHQFARSHAGGRILAMRQIQLLSPQSQVLLIGNAVRWEQETFQFFTPEAQGRNLSEAELYRNPPSIEQPTTFFVFDDADQTCIDFILKTYPGARRQGFLDGWNLPVFVALHVFPAHFEEHPQRHLETPRLMWQSHGWRLLGGVMLGAIAGGWYLLRRERRLLQKGTLLPPTAR